MTKISAKAVCDCGHFRLRRSTGRYGTTKACGIAGCDCLEFHQQLEFAGVADNSTEIAQHHRTSWHMPKHPAKNFKEP